MVDDCRICGGDGRISNAFGGSSATCPACSGNGRRTESEGIRDVTKTKPSHHRGPNQAAVAEKQTWPATFAGAALANEVKASGVPEQVRARLIREIIDYEGTHGNCTKTFTKKIRKQLGPSA